MNGNKNTAVGSSIVAHVFTAFVVLVLVIAAIGLSMYLRFQDSRLVLTDTEITYSIAAGTSLNQLAYDLQSRGMIEYPRLFILLGRELDAARRLKVGEYTLSRGLTPRTFLEQVTEGKVLQYRLTLIEGQTFNEMMARIQSDPVIRQTLDEAEATDIMKALGYEDVHPEGRFLPDTYNYPRGTTDRDFLIRAYAAMQLVLAQEWENREENLPLDSPEEALILASIVEKETGLASERARIAGVFSRRLQKGMKLQTDPTVIYGLGKGFDGNLRKRDLLADTPYNTYTRYGLPPTPIAMPGADAIRAVLHPEAGDSLYFVATGDGGHYFSSTLKEHELAVDKYQRGKRGITLPGESSKVKVIKQ